MDGGALQRRSVSLQAVVLGATFIMLGFISDGTYALVSARVSRAIRTRRTHRPARRWLPGLTLIALGVASALTGRRSAVA